MDKRCFEPLVEAFVWSCFCISNLLRKNGDGHVMMAIKYHPEALRFRFRPAGKRASALWRPTAGDNKGVRWCARTQDAGCRGRRRARHQVGKSLWERRRFQLRRLALAVSQVRSVSIIPLTTLAFFPYKTFAKSSQVQVPQGKLNFSRTTRISSTINATKTKTHPRDAAGPEGGFLFCFAGYRVVVGEMRGLQVFKVGDGSCTGFRQGSKRDKQLRPI